MITTSLWRNTAIKTHRLIAVRYYLFTFSIHLYFNTLARAELFPKANPVLENGVNVGSSDCQILCYRGASPPWDL